MILLKQEKFILKLNAKMLFDQLNCRIFKLLISQKLKEV